MKKLLIGLTLVTMVSGVAFAKTCYKVEQRKATMALPASSDKTPVRIEKGENYFCVTLTGISCELGNFKNKAEAEETAKTFNTDPTCELHK